jgi:hypothetical protein
LNPCSNWAEESECNISNHCDGYLLLSIIPRSQAKT